MYYTREYCVLAGEQEVILKPNTPFEAFGGDYLVTAAAHIRDESDKIVMILQPGQKIKGIGEVIAKENPLQDLSAKELKQMAITEGITIPSKATKSELIDLIKG